MAILLATSACFSGGSAETTLEACAAGRYERIRAIV